jgi:uncharacterized protein (DUF1330 family)
MTAYVIVYRETSVQDEEGMVRYSELNRANAASFVEQFGLRPLSVYGQAEAPEGAKPDGVVLLQFPTYEAAKAWYESPAYQAALGHRTKAAEWRVVIVQGLDA